MKLFNFTMGRVSYPGKYIVIALLVLLFLPLTWVKQLLSVLSFSILGVPVWVLLIVGVYIFLHRWYWLNVVLGQARTKARWWKW